MEVGTLETVVETKENRRRRPGLSGTGSGGSGGNKRGGGGGGNNGGDDSPNNSRDVQETERYKPNKSKILMWFLLVVVIMTFGGLIGAYIVISTNKVLEWQPFVLPVQVWISTLLILLSSFSYEAARRAIEKEDQPKSKKWLMTTTVLGAAFISSQILAWWALVRQGFYVQSNQYAGFFYILTAVHALHVLGGLVALGSIVLRTWNHQTENGESALRLKTMAQVVGWYWHLMGGLWLTLLFLLGFWK